MYEAKGTIERFTYVEDVKVVARDLVFELKRGLIRRKTGLAILGGLLGRTKLQGAATRRY